MSYRVKLALFALSALFFLFVLDTAYEGWKTLKRLDVVESERDQWQRPSTDRGGGGSNKWGRTTPAAGFQQITTPVALRATSPPHLRRGVFMQSSEFRDRN